MLNITHRRVLDSLVTSAGENAISVDVLISDNGTPLRLTTVTRFPELRIVEARAEIIQPNEFGPPCYLDWPLPELVGIVAGPGYVTAVRDTLKDKDLPPALLDALVESARMQVQVGNLPLEEVEGLDFTDSKVIRRMDLTLSPELAYSCLPYTEEMDHVFETRAIRWTGRPDIYAPREGQTYRFRRDKLLEDRYLDGKHILNASLSDDFHELHVTVHLSADGERLEEIESTSVRLPFPGICDLPFLRVPQLKGVLLDSDLSSIVIDAVGGSKGCIHLADLILDLVRWGQNVCGLP
ncbi:DUF2889 domain-containing protein [Thermodesulfobacteriota bacterium]